MSGRRRGATGLSGVLLVDKPAGMTSHDVVASVRRLTGEGRVGHAGTLDPLATGLLVVLVGPATRLEPYLSAADKSYLATISFGTETDTEDAEGNVVRSAPIPSRLDDAVWATEVLAGFLGESMQRPPAFSAIKVGGTTAYRAARAGTPLDLGLRAIRVSRAELTTIDPGHSGWVVDFTVSKGTYIRSLARDVGVAAGSAAHLSALRRSRSGPYDVAHAHSLDDLGTLAERGMLETAWADPVVGLDLPVLEVDARDIADGKALDSPGPSTAEGACHAIVSRGGASLLGIYRVSGDRLVPAVVFPTGVVRGSS